MRESTLHWTSSVSQIERKLQKPFCERQEASMKKILKESFNLVLDLISSSKKWSFQKPPSEHQKTKVRNSQRESLTCIETYQWVKEKNSCKFTKQVLLHHKILYFLYFCILTSLITSFAYLILNSIFHKFHNLCSYLI